MHTDRPPRERYLRGPPLSSGVSRTPPSPRGGDHQEVSGDPPQGSGDVEQVIALECDAGGHFGGTLRLSPKTSRSTARTDTRHFALRCASRRVPILGWRCPASSNATVGPSSPQRERIGRHLRFLPRCDHEPGLPSERASCCRRLDRLAVYPAPPDQPGDHRVRVPHVTGLEIIAAPHGRRHLRD